MSVFAVIKTGGKQYIVVTGQKLRIEKIAVSGGSEFNHGRDAKVGEKITFDEVLLVVNGDKVEIGTPHVKGAKVEAEVLGQGRDKKKIVFKYHAKARYRKKKGHRQLFTEVEIKKVVT